MTTDEFIKGISSDDIAHVVVKAFDELMVLYHMIGNRQDIEICTDNSKNPISFVLLMESDEEAIKLMETMNGIDFSIYGITYIINMNRSKSTVYTNIMKAS